MENKSSPVLGIYKQPFLLVVQKVETVQVKVENNEAERMGCDGASDLLLHSFANADQNLNTNLVLADNIKEEPLGIERSLLLSEDEPKLQPAFQDIIQTNNSIFNNTKPQLVCADMMKEEAMETEQSISKVGIKPEVAITDLCTTEKETVVQTNSNNLNEQCEDFPIKLEPRESHTEENCISASQVLPGNCLVQANVGGTQLFCRLKMAENPVNGLVEYMDCSDSANRDNRANLRINGVRNIEQCNNNQNICGNRLLAKAVNNEGIYKDCSGIDGDNNIIQNEPVCESSITPNCETSNSNEGIHVCLVCKRSFNDKKALVKHLGIHTAAELHKVYAEFSPVAPTIFQCQECYKSYTSEKEMKNHVSEKHWTGKGPLFYCSSCFYFSVNKGVVSRHMKRSGHKKIINLSGKTWNKELQFQRTPKEKHSKNDEESEHEQETHKVTDQSVVHVPDNVHMNDIEGENNTTSQNEQVSESSITRKCKYSNYNDGTCVCLVCKLTFININALIVHFRKHSASDLLKVYSESAFDKPLRSMCYQCHKGFPSRIEMKRHVWEEHWKDKGPCFSCSDCFFVSIYKSKVDRHMQRTGHQKILERLESDKSICNSSDVKKELRCKIWEKTKEIDRKSLEESKQKEENPNVTKKSAIKNFQYNFSWKATKRTKNINSKKFEGSKRKQTFHNVTEESAIENFQFNFSWKTQKQAINTDSSKKQGTHKKTKKAKVKKSKESKHKQTANPVRIQKDGIKCPSCSHFYHPKLFRYHIWFYHLQNSDSCFRNLKDEFNCNLCGLDDNGINTKEGGRQHLRSHILNPECKLVIRQLEETSDRDTYYSISDGKTLLQDITDSANKSGNKFIAVNALMENVVYLKLTSYNNTLNESNSKNETARLSPLKNTCSGLLQDDNEDTPAVEDIPLELSLQDEPMMADETAVEDIPLELSLQDEPMMADENSQTSLFEMKDSIYMIPPVYSDNDTENSWKDNDMENYSKDNSNLSTGCDSKKRKLDGTKEPVNCVEQVNIVDDSTSAGRNAITDLESHPVQMMISNEKNSKDSSTTQKEFEFSSQKQFLVIYLSAKCVAITRELNCDICKNRRLRETELDEILFILHVTFFHRGNIDGYSCKLCRKVYKTLQSLVIHFRGKSHSKLKIHKSQFDQYVSYANDFRTKCSYCKISFPSKESCLLHEKEHEKNMEYKCNIENKVKYKCKDCKSVFRFASGLKFHFRAGKHKNRQQYRLHCIYCGCRFMTERSCLLHEVVHEQCMSFKNKNDDRVLFKCEDCKYEFESSQDLRSHFEAVPHRKTVHTSFIQDNLCVYCGYFSTSKESFASHEEEHERCLAYNYANFKYRCNLCRAVFQTTQELKSHFLAGYHSQKIKSVSDRKKRGKSNQTVLCNYCGKKLNKLRWGCHMKDQHPEEIRDRCTECDECFLDDKSKIDHQNKSCYTCDICNMKCHSKLFLSRHLSSHLGLKKRWCNTCGKSHQSKDEWMNHKKECHTKYATVCEICGKEYRTTTTLKRHREKHLGGIFGCTYCSKFFYTEKDLKEHEKMQHSSGPGILCDKCGKICKYAQLFNYHEKICK